jgi:hypothetical protein
MDTNNILFCKDLNSGQITSISGINNGVIWNNPRSLSNITDISILNPQSKDMLVYNSTTSKWENNYIALSTLPDCNITNPIENNSYLRYDTSQAKWINSIPTYLSASNYAKFDATKFSTAVTYYNLLDPTLYTTSNINIQTNNFSVDAGGVISGFKNNINYLFEVNLTISPTSVSATTPQLFLSLFKNATAIYSQSPVYNTNNKNVSVYMSFVIGGTNILSSDTVSIRMANTSGTYTGLSPYDVNWTLSIQEL